MKTLYISDLDGTLLNSAATISSFTANTINSLIEKGMNFSYATARPYATAGKLTAQITARFPLILYNGAIVLDNKTAQPIAINCIEESVAMEIMDSIVGRGVYPLVYHYAENIERVAWYRAKSTAEAAEFMDNKQGDVCRLNISSEKEFYQKNIYYITCIDTAEKLLPLYQQLKDNAELNVIYQTDIYSGRQWLEIMAVTASKANAILKLKEMLGCDRLVCFGDGKNDISMFNLCDEGWAVANAVEQLKAVATGVIESNDNDGVAKWLAENRDCLK